MVLLKRATAVTVALLLLVALATTSVVQHSHGPDAPGGHGECDACHFRHLPVVETDRAPAPSVPDLVAHAVPSVRLQREQRTDLGIRPTRGPPA
ncbi:MAG: hypothetical protein OXQ28_04835 [Acidobacteriota bacterium]|nr:hypothetical protein [Acidobacteriota bacterium]